MQKIIELYSAFIWYKLTWIPIEIYDEDEKSGCEEFRKNILLEKYARTIDQRKAWQKAVDAASEGEKDKWQRQRVQPGRSWETWRGVLFDGRVLRVSAFLIVKKWGEEGNKSY